MKKLILSKHFRMLICNGSWCQTICYRAHYSSSSTPPNKDENIEVHLDSTELFNSESSNVTEDPYDVLGVSRKATLEEIKQAHSNIVVENHSVRTRGDPEAQLIYIKANNSYRSIIEARHKEGALVRQEDIGTLMPYDFSIKPINIENISEETFWDGIPSTIKILMFVIFVYVCKQIQDILPEYEDKIKGVPTTKREIAEDIRAEMYFIMEEERNIEELKEKLGKSFSSLMPR